MVYDRTIYNAINFIQNQSSWIFQTSVVQNYGQTDPKAALAADPRLGGSLTSVPTPPAATPVTIPYTPYPATATTQFSGLGQGSSNIAVDPNLKDPYSVAVNAGVQQELPGHFIMKLNYVGRFGRRLLAQTDAAQLIDYKDPVSGQLLSQAFAAITTQYRNNPTLSGYSVTPQPFFENQIPRALGGLYLNKTSIITVNQTTNVKLGDPTDIIKFLAANNLWNANVGMSSQFAENDYYTNKGSSVYHGMLMTVSKNMSQGLKFDFNYTWSHSLDNVSVVANTVANGTGFVCDALNLRACRGNSDFDNTHIVNANIVYQLPFGRGRQFASHTNRALDEVIGGWNIAAIPDWQSGAAFSPSTSAFLAGFAANDPAIYDGSRSNDVAMHLHKNASGQLLAFNDPNTALSHFRGPVGIEYGSRNVLRGPSQFYMDASLNKVFAVLPDNRLNLNFQAAGYNVLNHPTFATPAVSLASVSTFGVISAATNPVGGYPYRTMQFSLRLEF